MGVIKRIINILIVFLVSLLIFAPSASAWTWQTHSNIVDAVYYSMPANVQHKLKLNIMRDASNDPDEKFHDTRSHSYSSSYKKAKTWLDKGKVAYRNRNYNYASYCFGVASHYISDTYSAPHTVSGESSSQHSKYENQAKYMKPSLWYMGGSLQSKLYYGYKIGKVSWKNWSKSKNPVIVHNDLNRATAATYSSIRSCVY